MPGPEKTTARTSPPSHRLFAGAGGSHKHRQARRGRHGRSRHPEVVIRYRERELELDVVDDGRGAVASVNGSGHGLIGMRERVALYVGTLEVGPSNGSGYVVRTRLPLGEAT